ncbi:ArnT family glycosyltransferase [Pseudoduganella sp. R-31]|uniref:ArnT family glycosyltransferase n=1 Tax=unclassified Pseudoduganella TaxID=2637179 RepID=UPI003CFB7318
MINKLVYTLSHYFALLIFLGACWGVGRAMLRRWASEVIQQEPEEALLWHAIAATLGMGLYICVLQWLAIAGQLRMIPLVLVLVLGLGLCLAEWRALQGRWWAAMVPQWREANWPARGTALLIALMVFPTLVAPLCPPIVWDEVMYHLPHAQEWARSGRLTVNDWLRYPWFPYNANLLFAGAMIAYDDVMTHLISALMAWLTTVLVYVTGKRYAGQGVASIATLIYLYLTRSLYDNAMVDAAVTLFIFAGCLVFYRWQQQPQRRALLAMACFLLGVAVGIKYQALQLLPVPAIVLLVRTRSPRDWLIAAVALLLPCAYWYARNYVLTGDPVNPIGGKLFGFSDWNLGDFQHQFEDLKRNEGWPVWFIWPALLAPVIASVRRLPGVRAGSMLAALSITLWLLSSHYPRYLMPLYPVLALLAAAVWYWLFVAVWKLLARGETSKLQSKAVAVCVALGLLAVLPGALKTVHRTWKLVSPTTAAREAVLQQRITGYPMLVYLREHPMGRTYQFGLEDSIYYAPPRTGGDHFGPGRYRDHADLPPADLAKALRRSGYASLLIHTVRWPGIETKPGFAQFFTLVHRDGPVSLYRIAEPAPSAAPAN